MRPKERAYQRIRERLGTGFWPPGTQLPLLEELAEYCSVSRATMARVVAQLRAESLVHTKQKGGIVAGPQGTAALKTAAQRHGQMWKQLKDRLNRDVLLGLFPGQTLPLTTKLALQYNVNIRTMRKVLISLVAEGAFVREGRNYRLSPLRSSSSHAPIIFIAQKGSILGDQRTRDVAASFERDCSRLGMGFVYEGYDVHDPRGYIEMCAALDRTAIIRGCILSMWTPWDKTLERRWVDLIGYLCAKKWPTVVIDQAGTLSLPHALFASGWVRVLRIVDDKAGEAVADALLRRGHQRIAFVNRGIGVDWVRARYDGLRNHVKRCGGPEATVELFTLHESTDLNDLVLALLDLEGPEIRALYHETHTEEEILELQKKSELVRKKSPFDILGDDPVISTIQFTAKGLAALAGRTHDRSVYVHQMENLLNVTSVKATELHLRPFLEKVLAESQATAWVFPDERSALVAVAFLKSKGVSVPKDISVFGFDKWRENFEQQLSTYDFNMSGLVQRALHLVIDEKEFKSSKVIEKVDGFVVERKTTRR